MNTAYENIIDVARIASYESKENINDILALAQREHIAPASQDEKRTLLLAIDVQNDFMENIGSLAVQGSKGDVQRLTQWMYRNIESLTQVICSLDCHSMMQIFQDRKSTRLNSSHVKISYAVFCLKKKKTM